MPDKKPSALIRVFLLLKNRKGAVAFLLVLVIIAQAGNIVVPFISKVMIDTLTLHIKNGGALPWATLIYAALGILLATIFSSVLQSSYNYNLFQLVTKTEDTLRNAVFKKYLQLHALFHHGSSSGQIIGRIERGGIATYSILNDIVGQILVPSTVVFLGTFAVLLYKNVWIALAVLIPFPIYLFLTRKISKQIYEIEQRSNDAFENVSKESYDVAGNVLTVKKFSQEYPETKNHKEMMASARLIQYEAEKLWAVTDNIQTAISTVGRVAVLLLSAWFVLRGNATIGDFVLYVTLQNMAYQPLNQLSSIFTRLRRNITRVERMFLVLDEQVGIVDKPNAIELPLLQHQIEFKNVSFAYHAEKWALKNINLVIPEGSTIALVGRSGSGKTTFINLLLRSFDPQAGAILIDGTDIREGTQESLRQQIAVVPQEVDLFSRTVAENISYGRPDVSRAQIENAARTALAHDFIIKLENGYETVVGERGIKLSGGERQRIGIARAVLRDPRILVLDEATSHLDTESERLIARATDQLIKHRTSIIIAHRFSTILSSDSIVVFKDGLIEAVGKHKELLKKSLTYKKLHSLQFIEEDQDDEGAEEDSKQEKEFDKKETLAPKLGLTRNIIN